MRRQEQIFWQRFDTDPIQVIFIQPPTGNEPEWIKRSWLGVEIPAVLGQVREFEQFDKVTRELVEPPLGWHTPAVIAIDALMRFGNPKAADYWRANGHYNWGRAFTFPHPSCQPCE